MNESVCCFQEHMQSARTKESADVYGSGGTTVSSNFDGNLDREKIVASALRVIENDAAAVRSAGAAIDDVFFDVVRLLAACSGKVIVTGCGTSAAVAARGAHLFSVGGTPAFFLSPGDGLHGGLGVIRSEDIILALSKGGSSSELNEFCTRAKKLGKALVIVTSRQNSPLAELADYVLFVPLPPDTDLGSVIATGSSLAAGALLDALVESCRIAKGYTWESFFYTHPGGAVGANANTTLEKLKR